MNLLLFRRSLWSKSCAYAYAYADAYVAHFIAFLCLSFVLGYAYAYVASENQALWAHIVVHHAQNVSRKMELSL